MEANERKVFVILEEHMSDRFQYVINKYSFNSYCVRNFGNLNTGASISKILSRLYNRKILLSEYKKLYSWIKKQLKEKKIDTIYLSNSEGYIAHNIAKKLKKDFPHMFLIGLQHGVFALSKPQYTFGRFLLNNISKALFSIYPLGVGFGTKIVDCYYVYNQAYKNFLISECGWIESAVKVDLKFLKAELYDKKSDLKKNDDVAVFLLQGLSKAKICSDESEKYLNNRIVKFLSQKHKKVLIKEHPAFKEGARVDLEPNCEYVDNLTEAFNISKFAYSYTSTALIDADIFDIETYAITSTLIKGQKEVYKLFKNKISFEKTIDI